jgi:hypothetical protein
MAGGNLTLPERDYREFFVLLAPTESFCMRRQVNFLSLSGEGSKPNLQISVKAASEKAGDIRENTPVITAGMDRARVLTYRRSNE